MITREQQTEIDIELTKLLFDIDPMNTCCKENDCFDEYQSISIEIVSYITIYLNALQNPDELNINHAIYVAILSKFKEYFDDYIPSDDDMNKLRKFLKICFTNVLN